MSTAEAITIAHKSGGYERNLVVTKKVMQLGPEEDNETRESRKRALSNNLRRVSFVPRRLQSCFKMALFGARVVFHPNESHNRLRDAAGQDQGDVIRLLG